MRKTHILLLAFLLSVLVAACSQTEPRTALTETKLAVLETSIIEPVAEPITEAIPELEQIVEPTSKPVPKSEIMEEVIVSWTDVSDPESNYINPEYDPNPAPVEEPVDDMVWIPHSGSKYHSKSSCSGMKGPSQVSLADAQRRGYDPCKKCY